jgi:uncharacterized repeat protein (TIGR01451 family)
MTIKRILVCASLGVPVALGLASSAQAAGLAAGTVISNTATATFNSGSTISSNTVTVKVDQLIDVAVAGLNASAVPASATAAVLTYSVTNTGNGPSTFTLAVDPNVSGNPFNGSIQSIVIDSNNNNTYDAGTDTVYSAGGATPSLAADASIKVFVLATLPGSGVSDGQVSQIKLTATSSIGSGTPGTVISGGGTGGVNAVVGSSTGRANANNSIVANLSGVSLTKAIVSIVDPFGGTPPGSTAVPGSVITYSITSKVTGSATINNLHILDTIPTGTTYQAGTLRLGSTGLTDASDADAGTASQTSGIDVSLGNVVGGSADQVVTFKVKIN